MKRSTPMSSTVMGLTLVEILIGLGVVGLIMAFTASFFYASSQASAQSRVRSDMQQDIVSAQQLITGRLKEAWYIYPLGTSINLGAGQLRKIAVNATSTLAVASNMNNPILAMILPPITPGGACVAPAGTATNTTLEATQGRLITTGSGEDNSGCYRFFAYYPVKRSQWLSNTDASGSSYPEPDSVNGEAWVLAEYRNYYYGTTNPPAITAGVAAFPSTTLNTSSVFLFADYVAPTIPTTGLTTSTPVDQRYVMFSYLPVATTAVPSPPVTGVTLKLASTRILGNKTIRLPDNNNEYSVTIYPSNLGKVPGS